MNAVDRVEISYLVPEISMSKSQQDDAAATTRTTTTTSWLSSRNFFRGAKSIVMPIMQISFVMLIFLLFSDQILGGGKLAQGGRPCPPVEESQAIKTITVTIKIVTSLGSHVDQ